DPGAARARRRGRGQRRSRTPALRRAGGDRPGPDSERRLRDARAGHRPMSVLIAGHPMPPRLTEGTDPGLVAWRERLPELVEGFLDRWSLTASAPFLPGGSSAWVAPVRGTDGGELVLKVAWAHDESRDEAAGMAAWQGHGSAHVHRHERDGETAALLLDRVRPGIPLAELRTWPERDEVVAALARRLRRPPGELVGAAAAAGFRPLSGMCAWWADEAQQRAAMGPSPLPRELVEHGLELFRELPAQWDGEAVLLATDLHPGNVLSSTGAGIELLGQSWVLIDPKPYVGDPHYDVLQHMFNDPDRLRDHPGAFAARMARLAGLDPARLRRWLFARGVQEAGVRAAAAEAARRLAGGGVGWPPGPVSVPSRAARRCAPRRRPRPRRPVPRASRARREFPHRW